MSRVSRHQLLGSCAVALSLVAVGYAPKVRAQSFPQAAFQGTPTFTAGSGSVTPVAGTIPTARVDTINVSSSQAIITWDPEVGGVLPAGTIDFLPTGATANFTYSGSGNYIVLNRIVAPSDNTRGISINGTVTSGSNGSIWFYSPGGIAVGAGASFNVGNLVLSTAEFGYGGSGFFSTPNTLDLGGAGNPARAGSAVTIAATANIRLANPGSYFAVVAPVISQAGTVAVDGSVAYIAAARTSFTINAGMFDIQFATDGEALTHTGATRDSGATIFAAVAKNTAISVLLSGNIGYDASAATVENGQVVLLGGFANIVNTNPVNLQPVNFTLGGGAGATNFTSAVTAKTYGSITGISSGANQSLTFSSDVNLSGTVTGPLAASGKAELSATNGGSIGVLGDLTLTSRSLLGADGGLASLNAQNGASLSVTGTTLLDTSATGALVNLAVGGTGTGGTSSIVVNGATMTLTGATRLIADGTGGGSSVTGGMGQGGTASVDVSNGGLGLTAANLTLSANGVGGEYGYGAASGGGGNGQGGTASLTITDAAVTTADLLVTANGYGGYATAGTVAGNGVGGETKFSISGGGSAAQFTSVTLRADGASRKELLPIGENVAFASNGGDGQGGLLTVDLLGGTVTLGTITTPTGTFEASADGFGSQAFSNGTFSERTAGSGSGGMITATMTGGTVNSGLVDFHANGIGGGVSGLTDYGTSGGSGSGGSVTFGASGGDFTGGVTLSANGTGGMGGQSGAFANGISGVGGSGLGGIVEFTASGTAFNTDNLALSANSVGGQGGSAETGYGSAVGNGGAGGNANPGSATVRIEGGNSRFGVVTVDANSNAGRGGDAETGYGTSVTAGSGGAALGGNASILITGGSSNISSLTATATGTGGSGGYAGNSFADSATANSAPGGTGTGGTALVSVAGIVNNLDSISVLSDAYGGGGGSGDVGAAGSDAFGGQSSLVVDTFGLGLTSVNLSSSAQGGEAGYGAFNAGAKGGDATGGQIDFSLTGGATLNFSDSETDFTMNGKAFGGTGGSGTEGFAGGDGGNATGGRLTVLTDSSVLDLTAPTLNLDASSVGGKGGFGGNASNLNAVGGAGGNGGAANGGTLKLVATGADASLIFGNSEFGYGVSAFGGAGGQGGRGSDGVMGADGSTGAPGMAGGNGTNGTAGFAGGSGGNGGLGTAGTFEIAANDGGLFTTGLTTFSADGFGGDAGIGGNGGNGGYAGNGGTGGVGTPGINGGNGGDGGAGGNGGDGGDAGSMGTAGAGAGGSFVFTANGGSIRANDLTVTATGHSGFASTFGNGEGGEGGGGGQPGFGGGGGLGGTGGAADPETLGAIAGNEGASGTFGFRNFSSGFGSVDSNSRGGSIDFTTTNGGSMNFGAVTATVEAITNEFFGEQRYGNFGTISFNSLGGTNAAQTMNFASLDVSAGYSYYPDDSGAINFDLSNPLNVAGNVNLTTSGVTTIAANGAGGLIAEGDVTINAGDFIVLRHDSPVMGAGSPAFTTLSGNNLSFSTSTGIDAMGSSIVSQNDILVQSGAAIILGSASAGGDISLFGQSQQFDTLTSGGDIRVVAYSGDLIGGNAASAGNFDAEAGYGSIGLTSASAGGTANVFTREAVTLGTGQSGGDFTINAGTTVDIGRITTTGIGADTEETANISITTDGAVTVGHAEAANSIIASAASLVTGNNSLIAGDDILINTVGDSTLGVTTAGGLVNVSAGGAVNYTTINAGGDLTLLAGTDIIGGSATSGGALSFTSGTGNISFGDLAAQSQLSAISSGTISGTSARVANGLLTFNGNLGVNVSTLVSGGEVQLFAQNGDVRVDTDLSAAGQTVAAARSIYLRSQNGISSNSMIATAGGIDVLARGNLDFADTQATGDVWLVSTGGNISLGTIGTGGDMRVVASSGNLVGGNATSAGNFDAEAGYGSIGLTRVLAGGTANLFTRAAVTLGTGQSGGDFTINAGTTVDIDRVTTTGLAPAPQSATISITTDGAVTVGHAEAANRIIASAASLVTGNNSLIAGDDILINTVGDSTLGVTTAGGLVNVSAGGAVNYTTINAGGDLTLLAGTDIIGGSATSGGALSFTSGTGNISFGDLAAQSQLSAISSGTISGTSARVGNGLLTLNGDLGINVSTLVSGGDTQLFAQNGDVRVDTDLSSAGQTVATGRSIYLRSQNGISSNSMIATAGGIDVLASGNLDFADTQATGDVSLVSTGGNVSVGTIGTGGETPLVPSNVTVTALGSLTLGSSVVTRNALLLRSTNGATTINGLATGTTISVTSPAIVISPNATVGTAGTTTQVTFTNNSGAVTTIGGSAATTGYVLNNAELQHVFSNNLAIFTSRPRPQDGTQSPASISSTVAPDTILDTLNLSGGAGGAFAGGTFHIETGGKLRIIGPVALTNLGTANRFEIVASDAIEALPTSSVTLKASDNSLTGTLALTSADIIAGSASALSDIASAANLTAASDRIGKNDVAPNDNGYFAASAIIATVGNSIYIQNTGASTTAGNVDYDARRGFTVGDGGFTIVQATSAPIKIAINGRQVSPATATTPGGFFTGVDLIPKIRIIAFGQPQPNGAPTQTPGKFDPLSTVNGCLILSATNCTAPLTPIIPVDPGPSIARDTIEHAVEQFQAEGQLLPVALVQFQDFKGFIDQPLIDEPVTGAGNDDLYSLDDTQLCDPDQKLACK